MQCKLLNANNTEVGQNFVQYDVRKGDDHANTKHGGYKQEALIRCKKRNTSSRKTYMNEY